MNTPGKEAKVPVVSTVGGASLPFRFAVARPARLFSFTLVEMLVAMAVLGIILFLLVQISSIVVMSTNGLSKQMAAGEAARAVQASLGADLANMAREYGLTVFANPSSSGAVALAFVTESRGTSSNDRFMGVGYQLSTTNGELRRYSTPIEWTDQNLVADAVATIPASTTTTNNFSVLAQGILQFCAVAVLDNGSIEPLTANSQWNNSTINGQAIPLPFFGLNLTDRGLGGSGTPTYSRNRVQALIVGVVAVDTQNYALLTNSSQWTPNEGENLFPSITTANQTPMDAWEPVLWNGGLSGLPKPVVPAIQVFQSTYPLN